MDQINPARKGSNEMILEELDSSNEKMSSSLIFFNASCTVLIVFLIANNFKTDKVLYLQVLDTRGRLLTALGYGLWPSMVLLAEVVQTFILADFCYYYVKR